MGMDHLGQIKTTQDPLIHFLKGLKNGVHMVTDFHRMQEPCFQGGKNSSMKRYPHKAQAHVCPRTLEHPISAAARTADLFFSRSSFLSLFPSLIHLFFLSPYPFFQTPLLCAYTRRSGINIPIFMPSVIY